MLGKMRTSMVESMLPLYTCLFNLFATHAKPIEEHVYVYIF